MFRYITIQTCLHLYRQKLLKFGWFDVMWQETPRVEIRPGRINWDRAEMAQTGQNYHYFPKRAENQNDQNLMVVWWYRIKHIHNMDIANSSMTNRIIWCNSICSYSRIADKSFLYVVGLNSDCQTRSYIVISKSKPYAVNLCKSWVTILSKLTKGCETDEAPSVSEETKVLFYRSKGPDKFPGLQDCSQPLRYKEGKEGKLGKYCECPPLVAIIDQWAVATLKIFD